MKSGFRFSYAFMHACTAATVVTGLVYGWMRYGHTSADPFAVVNHPLEPLFHALHILVAPALALMLGAFWISHAWPHFLRGETDGRFSGLAMLVTALPMVFSGYLLQTATDSPWREIWMWMHDVTSMLWTLMFGLHVIARQGRAHRRP